MKWRFACRLRCPSSPIIATSLPARGLYMAKTRSRLEVLRITVYWPGEWSSAACVSLRFIREGGTYIRTLWVTCPSFALLRIEDLMRLSQTCNVAACWTTRWSLGGAKLAEPFTARAAFQKTTTDATIIRVASPHGWPAAERRKVTCMGKPTISATTWQRIRCTCVTLTQLFFTFSV